MKRILITGAGSYIGENVKGWLGRWPEKYAVDTISVKDDLWRNYDFSKYDTVFHVAGIVHLKEHPQMESLYLSVNRDLTIAVAQKAKQSGVTQFIFMSSMSVYGLEGKIGEPVIITKATPCQPNTMYGKSKYAAEQGLQQLADGSFAVAIVRAPMIYGKGAKGNYPKLVKLVKKLSFFPDIDNQRSMLYIDNLCEFIRLLVDNEEAGVFFPQNAEYVKTVEMVKEIAGIHQKKVKMTRIFNGLLMFLGQRNNLVNKVFGNLVYDKSISRYQKEYWVVDFKNSIKFTQM